MSLGERTGKSLVFSIDGKREVNLKTLSKYFKTMLEAAEIEDVAGRGIVLYSLRHFMITQRIMAGLSYRQVVDMCGTSIMMLEKTYWHFFLIFKKNTARGIILRVFFLSVIIFL